MHAVNSRVRKVRQLDGWQRRAVETTKVKRLEKSGGSKKNRPNLGREASTYGDRQHSAQQPFHNRNSMDSPLAPTASIPLACE